MVSMTYNKIFSNERYIPFENLRNRGIQKDDKSRVDASFFSEIYRQVGNLTRVIIEANQSLNETSEPNFFQQAFDMQNIVAFTGRRGTGKTSAMLAFVDFLADNCTGLGDDFLEISKAYKFFVLQYVDSSAVSEEEDFFEILLFRMLQYLNYISESSSLNNRQRMNTELDILRGNISKVYSHYSNLNSHSFDESSSYTRMEAYISKHDVRREFRELVSDYNKFLLKYSGNSRSEKGFLVLCIDDIDMSRQEHLKILQCIYQYFMIPGVIVYMTMNTPVLMANVKKNFYESMDINAPEEKERILELSNEQANDFLKKILPSDMRITMPSWKKYDYKKLSTIKIILKKEGIGEQALEKIFPNLKGADWCLNPEGDSWGKSSSNIHTDIHGKKYADISPKLFVMKLLAERTKIFLDSQGYKPHFMEPDSLRNLYDIFYLLYNMENIPGFKTYSAIRCEYNRKILLDYLYFKMIPEMQLSNEESKLIRSIQSEPLSRRGRRIWEYYFRMFDSNYENIASLYSESSNQHECKFASDEKNKHRIKNYNFGEVFRCLYYGSRLKLFSKDFVKAVLASYAFSMPQLVEKEQEGKNEHDAKFLKGFFEYVLGEDNCVIVEQINLAITEIDENDFKQEIPKDQSNLIEYIVNNSAIMKKWAKEIATEPDILEEISKYYINNLGETNYPDGHFYSFRELRDVFSYSLLGQWSIDLIEADPLSGRGGYQMEVQIRNNEKDLTDENCIKRIINALLLLPISSKNDSIVFSGDSGKIIFHNVNPDPTSPILGSIKISHILNYRFKENDKDEKTICNLAEVIAYCVNGNNVNAKEINKTIVKVIIEKYFNINPCYWFLVEHTDITYNVIKRTITHFLYLSDENLQTIPSNSRYYKTIKEIFDNFYDRFNQKLIEILDDYDYDDVKKLFVNDSDNFVADLKNIYKDIIIVKLEQVLDATQGDGVSSKPKEEKEVGVANMPSYEYENTKEIIGNINISASQIIIKTGDIQNMTEDSNNEDENP